MEILRESILVNTLLVLNFMPAYIMEPTVYMKYPSGLACVGQNENSIVTIGRLYDTGSGILLPKIEMKTLSNNYYVEILSAETEIFGAYFCEETLNNITSKIEFIATSGRTGQIVGKVLTMTINLGEMLIVEMEFAGGRLLSNVELNWRHNGSVVEAWKNNNTILIPKAQPNHSGIYECYGKDQKNNHGLVMVFVRSCPKDRYGYGCRKLCKQCKNNGKCDDVTGECICPKTFSGPLCEKLCPLVPLHPGGICHEDCSIEIYDYIHSSSCNGTTFCTKRPFGCSCPSGLQINSNLQCHKGCSEGFYGAGCSEACHCQNIIKCNPITGGNCSGECVYGWEGDKCDEKAGVRNDLYAVIYPPDHNDAVYLDCGSSFRKDDIITIGLQPKNESDFVTLKNEISKIPYRKGIIAHFNNQVPTSVMYFCEELDGDIKTEVLLTLPLNDGRLINKIVFVGENISLHAAHKETPIIEWYYNETKYLSNATILNLTNIQLADSGSYEYSKGKGYFLIVKGCKNGKFGLDCWLIGPGCYNDGYMDEGGCLCPPGFIGKYCEKACGEENSDKETSLCNRVTQCILCLPMPIGCTCHSGFTGRKCEQECPPGKYGADCTQICHCKNSLNACNRITGHCTGGCDVGWNGDMCQIKVIKENNSSIGIFGIDRQHTCNCKNGPSSCNKLTGKCTGGCAEHHVGESCNYKVCNRGSYGFKCSQTCYCNNSVSCDRITGHCPTSCAKGWMGKSCNIKEECSPGYFTKDCSKACHCKNSSSCDYWGSCENGCEDGWEGENCKTRIIETNQPTHSSSIPIVTAAIIGCLVLVIVMGAVACFLYHRKKRNLIRAAVRANVLNQAYTIQELPTINESSRSFKQNVRHKESVNSYGKIVQNLPLSKINWEDIKVLGILGRGHFGDVYRGTIITQDNKMVAIKTLRASARDDEWLEFVDEMKVMEKIGDHPNIVQLIGICYYQSKIFMITEYLSNGDLNSFLRKSRINFKDYRSSQKVISALSSAHLLQFALDIARGMNHLTEIQILHRDLAARNVLIGDDGIAKISDFGLARKGTLYVKVTNTALPIRWMALESLEEQTYTTKTDVWSFGVLLWEIATLGATPYPSLQTNVLIAKIREGYRLPRPYNCDNAMHELMRSCWDANPNNRPDFSHIMDSIADMLANDKDYLQLVSEEGYRFEPIDEAMEERGQD